MKKPLVVMTVIEMRTIGQQEAQWSDDLNRLRKAGPEYVRVLAKDETPNENAITAALKIPQSCAGTLTIGGKIAIFAIPDKEKS